MLSLDARTLVACPKESLIKKGCIGVYRRRGGIYSRSLRVRTQRYRLRLFSLLDLVTSVVDNLITSIRQFCVELDVVSFAHVFSTLSLYSTLLHFEFDRRTR